MLDASSIKNIHHKIGEILGESLRQDHARSAVEYLLVANQRDPVVTYLETCRGRAIEMSWEAIVKRIFKTDDERVPRAFVFYGNTNRSEFITDVESRRTFMIQIPEGETIDFEWIAANRDGLWGKALQDIDNGVSCTWTRSEYEQVHNQTMQFRVEDPIENLLDEFLATRNKVKIGDVIRCVLQVPPNMQELSHSRRVSELMQACGWIEYTTSAKQDGKSKSVRAFKRPANQQPANEIQDF